MPFFMCKQKYIRKLVAILIQLKYEAKRRKENLMKPTARAV